jgi:hypothetical protein
MLLHHYSDLQDCHSEENVCFLDRPPLGGVIMMNGVGSGSSNEVPKLVLELSRVVRSRNRYQFDV